MTARHDLFRLAEAIDFAARAHATQTRKGLRAEPYVNHLTDVVLRLARSPEADIDTLVAGALHDVVEDTGVDPTTVIARFGPRVAEFVAEVTDDKSLPKPERKRRQVASAAGKSDGAKRIKLADKASNLAAMIDSPPRHWDDDRRRAYLAWAREVAAGLRGVDPVLERGFDDAAAAAEAALAA